MGAFSKLFAAGIAALASADDASKVLVFTDKDIEEKVKEMSKGVLVEFYAPWCGHCKALAPEYDKASLMLEEQGSEYKLAKVDATVETAAAQKFGVQGYPTLKWFVGGAPTEYDGPREAAGIVDWIKSMTGPAVEEMEPPADLKGCAVTYSGPELIAAFEDAAKEQRKAAKWYYVKGDTAKMTIKHPGEDAAEFTEDLTKDKILELYKANALPKVGEINGETFAKYVARDGFGLIWGLFEMKADTFASVIEEKRPMLKEMAAALPKYSVTYTNTSEFAQVMESMFGVSSYPKVVIQKKAGDKKYFLYDGEMEASKIIEYVGKVDSGEIQPNLKSEAAPAEPQTDPVKVIVGSTMKEKVFTEDKDVLLEVYAPWCGHCKKLEPEYVKVGKKVEREGFQDKVVIAKMDGTANDSPVDSIEWSGFPTIVYVKKGSDKPIPFDGERTAKGIWKWIKTNSSFADEINAHIAKKKEGSGDEKTEL